MGLAKLFAVSTQQCGTAKNVEITDCHKKCNFLGRNQPFRIAFVSDQWELAVAAIIEPVTKGFQLTYFQTTC